MNYKKDKNKKCEYQRVKSSDSIFENLHQGDLHHYEQGAATEIVRYIAKSDTINAISNVGGIVAFLAMLIKPLVGASRRLRILLKKRIK